MSHNFINLMVSEAVKQNERNKQTPPSYNSAQTVNILARLIIERDVPIGLSFVLKWSSKYPLPKV